MKTDLSSPVATAEFSKFAGNLYYASNPGALFYTIGYMRTKIIAIL